ncbi:MAG TPA: GNAT family N-acetyltransferase [Gemmatimonadales bacterium]|nr:GNAT family N-acetyltransferase [Gemmatimonadales bacterium]
MDPEALIEIEHRQDEHRFVARIGADEAYLVYHPLKDGVLDYASTYTPPRLRDRHIASTIVKHALEYARMNGLKVVPSCWFVAGYIERHPEYGDLKA